MSTVITEERDEIVTITLNRPEKLNAIDGEVVDELYEVSEELEEDPTKGILLRGNGEATCAGVDTELVSSDDYYEEHPEFDTKILGFMDFIGRYPRPTVMAGRGAVVGAGFGFALECDLVVLGEETTFSYPEIRFGLFRERRPLLMKHIAGAGIAKELALTGDPIDPERALDAGFVNDVVPEDRVEERAEELLEQVVEYDPEAVKGLKDTLRLDATEEQ